VSEQRWRSGLGNGIVPPEGGMQFYSRDPELYTRLNALEADLAAARKRIDELEFIMRGLELVGQKDNEYLLALFLSTANAQTMPILVSAQHGTRGPQWWYMSVLILIMITPVILMAIALERYIAKGLLVGALKG